MQTRILGDSGIDASCVGLGAWAIGGWLWGGADDAQSIEAIQAGIDAGITLIDTAPVYGFGLSEEIVGRAIASRRDEVILATKCGLIWDREAGEFFFESEGKKIHCCLDPQSIRQEVERSLERMKTDRIDLYQTHWQEPTTPIEDTMALLLELRDEGKIRAIGVSNVNVEQLMAYRRLGVVASAQEKFSMLDRKIEAGLLPHCRKHGVAILAYSPLALGLLTGKISPSRQFGQDDMRSRNPRFEAENLEKNATMLDAFKPIAQDHGATIAQLVIAWTASRPGITHVLCGARNKQQAVENAAAGDLSLSEDEISRMDAIIERDADAS